MDQEAEFLLMTTALHYVICEQDAHPNFEKNQNFYREIAQQMAETFPLFKKTFEKRTTA